MPVMGCSLPLKLIVVGEGTERMTRFLPICILSSVPCPLITSQLLRGRAFPGICWPRWRSGPGKHCPLYPASASSVSPAAALMQAPKGPPKSPACWAPQLQKALEKLPSWTLSASTRAGHISSFSLASKAEKYCRLAARPA